MNAKLICKTVEDARESKKILRARTAAQSRK